MLNHIVANRCHYRLGMAPGTVPQQVCLLTDFLCLLFIHKWYSGSMGINLQNVLPIRESMILASSQNNESTNKSKEKTKQCWKEIEERIELDARPGPPSSVFSWLDGWLRPSVCCHFLHHFQVWSLMQFCLVNILNFRMVLLEQEQKGPSRGFQWRRFPFRNSKNKCVLKTTIKVCDSCSWWCHCISVGSRLRHCVGGTCASFSRAVYSRE